MGNVTAFVIETRLKSFRRRSDDIVDDMLIKYIPLLEEYRFQLGRIAQVAGSE
jgi:hypothetical protein